MDIGRCLPATADLKCIYTKGQKAAQRHNNFNGIGSVCTINWISECAATHDVLSIKNKTVICISYSFYYYTDIMEDHI